MFLTDVNFKEHLIERKDFLKSLSFAKLKLIPQKTRTTWLAHTVKKKVCYCMNDVARMREIKIILRVYIHTHIPYIYPKN